MTKYLGFFKVLRQIVKAVNNPPPESNNDSSMITRADIRRINRSAREREQGERVEFQRTMDKYSRWEKEAKEIVDKYKDNPERLKTSLIREEPFRREGYFSMYEAIIDELKKQNIGLK